MFKIRQQAYTLDDALDKCIEGITNRDTTYLTAINSNKSLFSQHETQYIKLAQIASLCTVAPLNLPHQDSDPIVFGSLKKSELNKLYTQYFVPENKPARAIYDAILNSSKEACPFCGGIGTPRNLDHYLPKKFFPQFGILPSNLVPSCLDCNLGAKKADFSSNEEGQPIHPYMDKSIFFNEKWITARYEPGTNGEPGIFVYFVETPASWSTTDEKRAESHFTDFDIGFRYAKQAVDGSNQGIALINKRKQKRLTNQDIAEIFEEAKSEAKFVNHWSVGMNEALINYVLTLP